jgi:hypothetical protein
VLVVEAIEDARCEEPVATAFASSAESNSTLRSRVDPVWTIKEDYVER